MLQMSDTALAIVQRSFTMALRVESWLNGTLLADDIPAADGSEDRDRSLAVPETISLTVPRTDRGTVWAPLHPGDPLSSFGQQLRISYGVDVGGDFEWISRGWFLVDDVEPSGDTLTVTAHGLLTLIDEAHFAAPFQPSSTDTLVSITQALVEPALTVAFDPALVDRAMPLGMQWDDDRMGALTDVLSAWPADCTVTEDGVLLIGPVADTGSPVFAITDAVGGTVVQWQGSTTRAGAFNCVVAQGEDSAGNTIQGVAYDTDPNSPFQFGGPFNPLPVPYTTTSALFTTVAQCQASAAATLQMLRRSASRVLAVTMVPHPGLVTGDIVSVTSADAGVTDAVGVIESLSLPYSPGEMTLNVRLL